jgi:hypothetical protein
MSLAHRKTVKCVSLWLRGGNQSVRNGFSDAGLERGVASAV